MYYLMEVDHFQKPGSYRTRFTVPERRLRESESVQLTKINKPRMAVLLSMNTSERHYGILRQLAR